MSDANTACLAVRGEAHTQLVPSRLPAAMIYRDLTHISFPRFQEFFAEFGLDCALPWMPQPHVPSAFNYPVFAA